MGVLKDKFISDFKLHYSGNKGWMIGDINNSLICPRCKNKDGSRLAFIFDKNTSISSFKCVKCGYSCRTEKYLYLIHKREYITKYRDISKEDILTKKRLINLNNENIDLLPLQEVMLPIMFKRIKYSNYLNKRGATLELYKKWIIGKTDYDESLKNYVIFVIQENNRNIGWVARNNKSKEEIKEYNSNNNKKILRWRNSKSDFGKIVFGLDEITSNTKTIIVVEGITSKMRIDCNLKLYNQEKIKCCCTFGKKTTYTQLYKIKNKGINVEKLILFYDSDAINESKNTVYKYVSLFKNVYVAFCNIKNDKGEYKDAGDLNIQELKYVLNNLQTPFIFFESKLEKKNLLK